MMPSKAMKVSSDSPNPSVPVPFVLTDAALIAIDSDDAPALTLTPAAVQELEAERRAAAAAVIMNELKRYPGLWMQTVDCFKQAYQAYDDYESAVGLVNVQESGKTFSEACEAMFFQFKAIFDLATRETSL